MEDYVKGGGFEPISPDKKLYKRVVTAGAKSPQRPPTGCQVSVRYTGKLPDGTVFDQSGDEPFRFRLGKSNVIQGWHMAIASMARGEKAEIVVHPDLAYGDKGFKPSVPPNTFLVFEITLEHWETRQKVTEDGLVMKTVHVKGQGYQRPNDGATVTLKMTGRIYPKGRIFDDRFTKNATTFVVGRDLSLTFGLEASIKNMYKGEVSDFFIKPIFAWGQTGNDEFKIPPNTTVEYHIELLDFKKGLESWDMTVEQKLEHGVELKEFANKFFKLGKLRQADEKYRKLAGMFQYTPQFKPEQQDTVKVLKVAALNNMSAVALKLGRPDDVLENCEQVLEIEPGNVKALARRARILLDRKKNEEALADLKLASKTAPDNPDVLRLLKVARARVAKAERKNRKAFSNFFDRVSIVEQSELDRHQLRKLKAERDRKRKEEEEEEEKKTAAPDDDDVPSLAADPDTVN